MITEKTFAAPIALGAQVAATLAGAWRAAPPAPNLSAADLGAIVPRLLESGAGALAWWRLRHSGLATTRPARQLREAYRLHSLQAATHEENLCEAVQRFRAAGIEPILIKGWSAARSYPETGLRPYGDLDLCVRPDQLAEAETVLTAAAGRCGWVELHEGVPDTTDRTWGELYQRSRLVPLGDSEIRVLGPEDHARLLCLHLWRHYTNRPLWLCDLGTILDSLPAGFDWDYVRHGDQLLVDWIDSLLALTGKLLDAPLEHPALAARAARLPRWLRNAVLWAWGSAPEQWSLAYYLRQPTGLLRAYQYRWLNPIKACYRMRLPSSCSFLWIQVVGALGKPAEVAARLGRQLGKKHRPAQPFDLHVAHSSKFL